MTSTIPETIGDLEAFRRECRELVQEGSLQPGERLYALFLRGVERQTIASQKGTLPPVAGVIQQARGALPGTPDLKAALIRGVFLTALEAGRQPAPPGAFAQVMSIVRLALGWGTFNAPSAGGDVDVAQLTKVSCDWKSAESQQEILALLEEWLAEPERFSRLGMVRSLGAMVVSYSAAGWYARAIAQKEGLGQAGPGHLTRARDILKGYLQGGSAAPLEKLMNTGLFAIFFDSLLARPPVVAALAGLL